jgi:hypothetical protein
LIQNCEGGGKEFVLPVESWGERWKRSVQMVRSQENRGLSGL